ncbi:MAG: hypothetical protein ABH828_02210 [archaeon]
MPEDEKETIFLGDSDSHRPYTGYDIEIQNAFDNFAEYPSTGKENLSRQFVQTAIENCDLDFEFFKNILVEIYAIRRFSDVSIDYINPPTAKNPLTVNKDNIAIVVTPVNGTKSNSELLEKNIIDGMKRLKLTNYKIKSKKGKYGINFALPGRVKDCTIDVFDPDAKENRKVDIYNLNNLRIEIKYDVK